jgi:hypothetical protein
LQDGAVVARVLRAVDLWGRDGSGIRDQGLGIRDRLARDELEMVVLE